MKLTQDFCYLFVVRHLVKKKKKIYNILLYDLKITLKKTTNEDNFCNWNQNKINIDHINEKSNITHGPIKQAINIIM